MPTVFIIKGYRFFFFSNENQEPIHIHVEKADNYAKFWIDPVFVSANYGFNSKQLKEISRYIEGRTDLIRQKWNEHFNQ
ncbi:MAG: DUF4160 domain-containing protein [Bacteroidales bacterium]|nr:DUF4160 domain-containing protein [Bacteroidales bacterium]